MYKFKSGLRISNQHPMCLFGTLNPNNNLTSLPCLLSPSITTPLIQARRPTSVSSTPPDDDLADGDGGIHDDGGNHVCAVNNDCANIMGI